MSIKALKQFILYLLSIWRTNHLLTCLAEECGEVMELIYLEPENIKSIEYELNDLVSVANLLHKENILNAKVTQVSTVVAEADKNNSSYKDIYRCVKEIQHFSHKSIRFGLLNSIKPNSKAKNFEEMAFLLELLVSLIQNNTKLSIWSLDKILPKQKKVLSYLSIAEKKLLSNRDQ